MSQQQILASFVNWAIIISGTVWILCKSSVRELSLHSHSFVSLPLATHPVNPPYYINPSPSLDVCASNLSMSQDFHPFLFKNHQSLKNQVHLGLEDFLHFPLGFKKVYESLNLKYCMLYSMNLERASYCITLSHTTLSTTTMAQIHTL